MEGKAYRIFELVLLILGCIYLTNGAFTIHLISDRKLQEQSLSEVHKLGFISAVEENGMRLDDGLVTIYVYHEAEQYYCLCYTKSILFPRYHLETVSKSTFLSKEELKSTSFFVKTASHDTTYQITFDNGVPILNILENHTNWQVRIILFILVFNLVTLPNQFFKKRPKE
ncbi:MAG: hypothetical protein PWP24_305 [Clostridiales bacterium]|nr:hypothetical protein [Clostridiales bacterium]